jgi:hypothetical protein
MTSFTSVYDLMSSRFEVGALFLNLLNTNSNMADYRANNNMRLLPAS